MKKTERSIRQKLTGSAQSYPLILILHGYRKINFTAQGAPFLKPTKIIFHIKSDKPGLIRTYTYTTPSTAQGHTCTKPNSVDSEQCGAAPIECFYLSVFTLAPHCVPWHRPPHLS